MEKILISESEKDYIVNGIQDDFRCDGRSCEDYRYVEIETGNLSHTSGSSSVQMGDTHVVCSVKAELGQPSVEKPREGNFFLHVEFSSTAFPSSEISNFHEELADSVKASLTAAYISKNAIDVAELCIVPGKKCWFLFIDILLLESDGNFLDAASLAVKAAFCTTKLPMIYSDERNRNVDFTDYNFKKLNCENVPLCVTLHKIGVSHIVDATREEESCSLARLAVFFQENGNIVCIQKAGGGALKTESISDMLYSAKTISVQLHKTLQAALDSEANIKKHSSHFM